jgi:hypothetical protein
MAALKRKLLLSRAILVRFAFPKSRAPTGSSMKEPDSLGSFLMMRTLDVRA